ncbi:MAG: hypothetical protein AAF399_26880 [Bacteroidota bacterium]
MLVIWVLVVLGFQWFPTTILAQSPAERADYLQQRVELKRQDWALSQQEPLFSGGGRVEQ